MKFRRRIFTKERWHNSPTVVAWAVNLAVAGLMAALLGVGFK